MRSHRGFDRMFRTGGLTVGVFFAIEAYRGAVPTMAGQVDLARRAEKLGFAALWFRDVPLLDPVFGDAGQVFDPWVYLGHIAAHTDGIALATGGIVLPLRHPIDVAKAAASVDVLSGGRMVLGLSGGDRFVEYPAYGVPYEDRAARFRDAVTYLRTLLDTPFPTVRSPLGTLDGGADLLPKPPAGRLPLLAVGRAGQALDWLAAEFDGFVTYPRPPSIQATVVSEWRAAAGPGRNLPFAQSLYVDLVEGPATPPTPIHLGWRLGRHALVDHLAALADAGVRHVVLNLKYGSRPAAEVLDELGEHVLPCLARGASTDQEGAA